MRKSAGRGDSTEEIGEGGVVQVCEWKRKGIKGELMT